MSDKKLEDLEIAKAYKIIKLNRFDGMYGETTTLIQGGPIKSAVLRNSVLPSNLIM